MAVTISGSVSIGATASGPSGSIFGDFIGAFTSPFIGTDQEPFTASTTFKKVVLHTFENVSGNVVVSIRKNNVITATATLLSGTNTATQVVNIPVQAGDFLTLDLTSGNCSNLSVRLDYS